MTLQVGRSGPLRGELRPPSDKSLTHRAYILAALARSRSTIVNPLRGEDCNATLAILQQLGATAEVGDEVLIEPPGGLQSPAAALDCGNSGTTMRLLAGVLAAQPGLEATLVGDASLSRRPMKRIIDPLVLMGADVSGDTPPVTVHGRRLHAVEYSTPVASAQIKSCLLLAGLFAEGRSCVSEPSQSRDHTERMLSALGVKVLKDGSTVCIEGGQSWDGFSFDVPADISSAAFLMCAGAMVPGSTVFLKDVGTNPTRTGVLNVLDQAGAGVTIEEVGEQMGEPVSQISVSHKGSLKAFEIGGALVPRLIDEIPVLAVLATQCEGTTRIRGAKELRVKESDRIEAVACGLRAMGASVETCEDGMDIDGPVGLRGTRIDAEGDHRIGMAFAVAGLVAEGETLIAGADSIRSSYPGFESDLASLRS